MSVACYVSVSHSNSLLSGLNSLRQEGHLVDVVLSAGGRDFPAHRAVLASCSDYFRAMFTDAMLERRRRRIPLKGISAEGVTLLLDYAYTSHLRLDRDNVMDALSAASHAQMTAVVEACESHLLKDVDSDNCVEMASVAEMYSLHALRSAAYSHIASCFTHLRDSNRLHDLSLDQFVHLLEGDYPVDCPESDILDSTLKYIANHPPNIQKHLREKLIPHIRFKDISDSDIDTVLKKFEDVQYVRECRLAAHTLKEHDDLPSVANLRGLEYTIVNVGGFGESGVTNEITYRSAEDRGQWRLLTTIPHLKQSNFGVAVSGNQLFVIGGCFDQSLQENVHPFGFRYSPLENEWKSVRAMTQGRCRFQLTAVGGYLYVTGGSMGWSELYDYEDGENDCERYDPASDTWSRVKSMPSGRSQHAACACPKPKLGLMVSGGIDSFRTLSSTLRYDPETDAWTELKPMLTPRADHALLLVGDKIYACGGWYEGAGGRTLVDTVDSYDPEMDSWEVVTRVPNPRYHGGMVASGSKIFFIGGLRQETIFNRATAAVEFYDVNERLWGTSDEYPSDIWEHVSVTLYVPKHKHNLAIKTRRSFKNNPEYPW